MIRMGCIIEKISSSSTLGRCVIIMLAAGMEVRI